MITVLKSEDQLLDPGFRAQVIREIIANEENANVDRKREALRKHEVYRDRIKKWVVESLIHENLKAETIRQMETRASNISIAKKVVNKLAQAYTQGVVRKVDDEQSQKAIDQLTSEMDVDTKMKKSDRYLELFKNSLIQIIPEPVSRESTQNDKKFKIKIRVLSPHQYDVIEDHFDKEQPRVFILTDFVERDDFLFPTLGPGEDGRKAFLREPRFFEGNRKEEIIADAPEDSGQDVRTFIWWSDRYHFTTDRDGKIIPELSGGFDPETGQATGLNPIEIMPFVSLAEDQDGEFWAQSGDDLIEGAILINKLITDMYAIAYHQGWGQMVITGKDILKFLEGGPHNAMVLTQESTDDPKPEVSFQSANPPLESWMRMIEQYVALYLTTNNLSVRTVAGKLDASSIASGIAELIERSESTADIKDRQKLYKDQEPLMWEIIKRWQNLLFDEGKLINDFQEIGRFENSDVNLEFNKSEQTITEKEKLEILKARKELGIDRMVDLIRKDNPELTEEEAEKRLIEIQQEKMKRLMEATSTMVGRDNGDLQEGRSEETQGPEEKEEETPINAEEEDRV